MGPLIVWLAHHRSFRSSGAGDNIQEAAGKGTQAPPVHNVQITALLIPVVYRKGSSLVLADTLSRAPLNIANDASPTNFDLFLVSVEHQDLQPNIHLTSATAKAMQPATKTDPSMQQLVQMVTTGWPSSKACLPVCLTPYWSVRDELSLVDGIVNRGLQVVFPPTLRSSMLKKIHASHMGADSNYGICRDILYWPGMKSAIQDICSSCGQCAQYGAQHAREPMQSMPILQYPWQFVSQDIFFLLEVECILIC